MIKFSSVNTDVTVNSRQLVRRQKKHSFQVDNAW